MVGTTKNWDRLSIPRLFNGCFRTSGARPPGSALLAFVAVFIGGTIYAQPLLIGEAIDALNHRDSAGSIDVLLLLGVTIGAWLTQWAQLTTTGWIDTNPVKLRTQMFDHLQTLSLSFYDRHEVADDVAGDE